MPVGVKKSPAKFLGAVALGLGVAKGAAQIIGGLSGGEARRAEETTAQREFDASKKDYQNLDTSNLYAGVKNQFSGMENTFEDLTVNQQQAQFEAQQTAQSQANILENLRGAAGGSGIAGLAQAMAGQSQLATQRASASIGAQEAANQRLSTQGAANIQLQERQGEAAAQSMRLQGASQARTLESAKTENLLSMSAGRLDAAKQARADALLEGQAQQDYYRASAEYRRAELENLPLEQKFDTLDNITETLKLAREGEIELTDERKLELNQASQLLTTQILALQGINPSSLIGPDPLEAARI